MMKFLRDKMLKFSCVSNLVDSVQLIASVHSTVLSNSDRSRPWNGNSFEALLPFWSCGKNSRMFLLSYIWRVRRAIPLLCFVSVRTHILTQKYIYYCDGCNHIGEGANVESDSYEKHFRLAPSHYPEHACSSDLWAATVQLRASLSALLLRVKEFHWGQLRSRRKPPRRRRPLEW